jgi:hypothetical protein
MRAHEFITENNRVKKLRKSTEKSIPNMRKYDQLDNSSPYYAYRFGVALAGSPDSDMDRSGPIGQKMSTIGYTDADDKITQAAAKVIGVTSTRLTGPGSHELDSANTLSPVPDRNTLKK